VDLELLYCCNTEVSIGFINSERSFRDLWTGESYAALRMQFLDNRFLPSCAQCGKYKQNVKWAMKLGRIQNAADLLAPTEPVSGAGGSV
jgi:hypothetical protein